MHGAKSKMNFSLTVLFSRSNPCSCSPFHLSVSKRRTTCGAELLTIVVEEYLAKPRCHRPKHVAAVSCPRFVEQPLAAKGLSVYSRDHHQSGRDPCETWAPLSGILHQANPSSPVSCRQRTLLERPSAGLGFLWTRLRKDFLRSLEGAPRACWTEVQPDLENLIL